MCHSTDLVDFFFTKSIIDHQKYRLKNSLKKQLAKKKHLSHVFAQIKSNRVKQAQKDQHKHLTLFVIKLSNPTLKSSLLLLNECRILVTLWL